MNIEINFNEIDVHRIFRVVAILAILLPSLDLGTAILNHAMLGETFFAIESNEGLIRAFIVGGVSQFISRYLVFHVGWNSTLVGMTYFLLKKRQRMLAIIPMLGLYANVALLLSAILSNLWGLITFKVL